MDSGLEFRVKGLGSRHLGIRVNGWSLAYEALNP